MTYVYDILVSIWKWILLEIFIYRKHENFCRDNWNKTTIYCFSFLIILLALNVLLINNYAHLSNSERRKNTINQLIYIHISLRHSLLTLHTSLIYHTYIVWRNIYIIITNQGFNFMEQYRANDNLYYLYDWRSIRLNKKISNIYS